MPISEEAKLRLRDLQKDFLLYKSGKDSLLLMLEETEMPEGVYNSNAIENNTLSLQETERILLEMEVTRNVSLREVFEAKNLARLMDYIRQKSLKEELSEEQILLWHQMLMMNINENIAGRYREKDEYVKVGRHVAAMPEKVPGLMREAITEYHSSLNRYFLERIARFHAQFEHIHPFNDGNGGMGRGVINFMLMKLNFPPIIIRNKDKEEYYDVLRQFDQRQDEKGLARLIGLALMESLHKRIAYLRGLKIIPLVDYAKEVGKSSQTILNAAKRQTIAAFRERGIWKIGL